MKIFFILLTFFLAPTSTVQVDKVLYRKIGKIPVYEVKTKNVYLFTTGMQIDADGSPKAYHSDSKKALDYLANAGKPGNWWALVTDNGNKSGNPIVQTENDPAPGYYVSMTSLEDNSEKTTDPKRYVNSEAVPYIAIPKNLSDNFHLGDIALVTNTKNNKRSFAIFADYGPPNKLGEGSIKLAESLGIKSSPKNGGTNKAITYILIKNSGLKKILSDKEIQERGKSLLSDSTINELLK